jgi:hypothetical protein
MTSNTSALAGAGRSTHVLYKTNYPKVKVPRRVGALLCELPDGLHCQQCAIEVRDLDIEALRPGLRILCRNGHLVFEAVPA